jgi:Rieske Fe-S protein
VIAAPAAALPQGMYISDRQPVRSFRPARVGGVDYVVVTGPSFKPGETGSERDAFAELESWLDATFALGDGDRFRWANEDFHPMDDLPFVGAASSGTPHLLVATGFDAWGITTGVLAGRILADAIEGRSHPLAPILDAARLRPIKGGATFVAENVRSGATLVRDRVLGGKESELADIAPGGGGIVRQDGRQLAVSRDASGEWRAVSAVCTHLGCIVGWNAVDRTWDCPCHGSRFDEAGAVLSGPAVAPLEPAGIHPETGTKSRT